MTRGRALLLPAAVIAFVGLQSPILARAALADRALVDALRRGGYVIYFRHATTDFSQTDTDRQDLTNCRAQRNLSDTGRLQAQAIGQAFRELRIPIGPVLASRYCRTVQTAQLAFGRVTPTWDLTALPQAPSEAERGQRVEALRRLLAAKPVAGTNTVLVGHLFNIRAATDLSIAEGEAAIFEPNGTRFRLSARVTPEEWVVLARRWGR